MFEHFERAEERYKNTIYAALLEGEERGEARGIKLGEERGEKAKELAIANIVRKMLDRNRPINEIIEDTGMTENEIRQIAH